MAESLLRIVGEVFFVSAAAIALAYFVFLLPPKHPVGIPSIPFWVALIPLFKDVDQQDIFRKYVKEPLETYGAVKIFFGSQWNVIVHSPTYLAEIFKNEDEYQKSGNQKKIPKSVLASFLGDNIISSHGEVWKLYQGILKPGLQRSFELDINILLGNAHKLCNLLLNDQSKAANGSALVQEIFQRYTIANFSQVFFRTDFGTLELEDAYLSRLQSSIKREIFKPIFMNFPFLDSFGLPSRERARRLASHFTDQLVAAIAQSVERRKPDDDSNELADRLFAARLTGTLTEKQFRDNATVAFVAGQENPQLGLISTVYLLAKHPEIQERLHEEVKAIGLETPNLEALQEMPWLTAVIFESLRLLPPIGQLINRRAARPLMLGDNIYIPEGTYLGYNCYSTNRDTEAWGADADEFRPQRWGESFQDIQRTYRRKRARSEFISFHGGRRACLGERFALLELKATLFVLCREARWRLDPTWIDRLTPAGPICPRALRIAVEKR